jgi:hypothetical protein
MLSGMVSERETAVELPFAAGPLSVRSRSCEPCHQ